VVAYWEAKLVNSETLRASGSLVLDLNGKVVEFTTAGPTSEEKLAQKTRGAGFNMVRFGPRYMVAEDARGMKIASLGILPNVMTEQFQQRLYDGPKVLMNNMRMGKTRPEFNQAAIRTYSSELEAYEDYVRNYDAYFTPKLKPAIPADLFGGVLKLMPEEVGEPDGGGGSGGSASAAEAIGHDKAIRMYQFPAGHGLNPTDHASGCGPAAFLNLFLWHNQNWLPGFAKPPLTKDQYEASLPNQVNADDPWVAMHLDNLGTTLSTFRVFPGTLGATFPWNMYRGLDVYAPTKFNHYADYIEATSFLDSEGEAIAINGIANHAKPVIVGYWDDIHYDVVWKWMKNGPENYFWTDMLTTEEALQNPNLTGKWIAGDDIFYAAFAFDFRSVGNSFGENASFEAGLMFWKHYATAGGKIEAVKKDPSAASGLGYMRMTGSNGSKQRAWTVVKTPSANVLGHEMTMYLRAPAGLKGVVRFRQATASDYTMPPSGAVLKEYPFTQQLPIWMVQRTPCRHGAHSRSRSSSPPRPVKP
jgi:hypothetical protein